MPFLGNDLTPEHLTRLRAFLDSPARLEGALTFRATQGFLFAIANGPVTVRPSEWIPGILHLEDAEFDTMAEAEDLMQGIMTLYNGTLQVSRVEGAIRPADLGADLDDADAMHQWSRGFVTGYSQLQETWDAVRDELDEEERERFDSMLLALSIWADPEKCREVRRLDEEGFAELVDVCRDGFPAAVGFYADSGWQIHKAMHSELGRDVTGRPGRLVGRNEPCPCGSGRKYKKCCLAG